MSSRGAFRPTRDLLFAWVTALRILEKPMIEFRFGKTPGKLRGLEEETLVTSPNPVSQVLW